MQLQTSSQKYHTSGCLDTRQNDRFGIAPDRIVFGSHLLKMIDIHSSNAKHVVLFLSIKIVYHVIYHYFHSELMLMRIPIEYETSLEKFIFEDELCYCFDNDRVSISQTKQSQNAASLYLSDDWIDLILYKYESHEKLDKMDMNARGGRLVWLH